MTELPRCALLLVYLVVCSASPGLFVLRRFRLGTLERLAASMALGNLIIYVGSFAIFALGFDARWNYALGALCLMAGLLCWRDWFALMKAGSSRRAIIGYAVLLGWILLALGLVRTYSGADWAGDWVEHYERARFIVDRPPPMTLLIGMYYFTARPPLMNTVAAFYLAQFGRNFYIFQLAFAALNLQAFLACALVARSLAGRRGAWAVSALVLLLMLNPLFMQNCTYTWTKTMAAGYVVLGIWLYYRGQRRRDSRRIVLAFAFLSAAILVHYTAAAFVVLVAGHYAFYRFWKRGAPWKEGMSALALSAGICATWFVWSLVNYGQLTFKYTPVNPSWGAVAPPTVEKFAINLCSTLVPFPLRGKFAPGSLPEDQGGYGRCRDYMFSLYQSNLLAAMGLAGGCVIVYLFARQMISGKWNGRSKRDDWWFWLIVVCVGTLSAIAIVAEPSQMGSACIVLQPVVLMGLSLLAGRFARLGTGLRWLIAAGLVCDFLLGILIHFDVQSVVFVQQTMPDGSVRYMSQPPVPLSRFAFGNWMAKEKLGLEFFGDFFAGYDGMIKGLLAAGFVIAIVWLMKGTRLRAPSDPSRKLVKLNS